MNCEVTARFQATFHSIHTRAPWNAFQASISLCIPSQPPGLAPSHPTVYDSNTRNLNRVYLCCWPFNHATYILPQIAPSEISEWVLQAYVQVWRFSFLDPIAVRLRLWQGFALETNQRFWSSGALFYLIGGKIGGQVWDHILFTSGSPSI